MDQKDLPHEREIFDLREPQPSLHSGKIPTYVTRDLATADVLEASLKRLLASTQKPQEVVTLWENADAAVAAFVRALPAPQGPNRKVATWRPSSLDLRLLGGAQILELSRDPSDWTATSFAGADFVLLQNPMLWDGYYLPEDIFLQALQTIESTHPNLPIFVDQRSLVFNWEELTPADARTCPISNPYLVLGSTKPALAPHVPGELAWIHSNMPLEASQSPLSAATLAEALFLVSSFKTKQGPFAAEFQKVVLVVKESLKRLSVEVQRLSRSHGFRVTHWPSGGLYLRLECTSELAATRLQKLLASHGVLVGSAAVYGDASALLLSYSMHLSQCDRLLKRFAELT